MKYTEADIERAARFLCASNNCSPDAFVVSWKGMAFAHSRAVWVLVAEEIREHIKIEEALAQTRISMNLGVIQL